MDVTETTAELPPGTTLDGKYTIVRTLLRRPSATTYEAHRLPEHSLAITFYDGACFPSVLVLERCLRELRQLERVKHEGVVPVLDAGRSGDGLYEVQPLFAGEPLASLLAREGALELPRAAAIVAAVGEAVLAAQRHGIPHRNLGGDTVLIAPGAPARVQIIGFAVAEPRGGDSFGPLLGIAPEQVEGKAIDQRTLVYNLACLTHWMLTGSPLFSGEPADVLAAHRSGELPAQVHPRLHRALAKDPRMRPMMLKGFAAELAELGGVRLREPPRAQPDAPVASATRGWTMFTHAAESPATANSSVPTPSTGSGRGWTMFMEAAEAPSDDVSASEASPPSDARTPPAPVASPASDVARSSPASGGTPSSAGGTSASSETPGSRGWTMFMEPKQAGQEVASGAAEHEGRAKPPMPRTGTLHFPHPSPPASQAGAAKPPNHSNHSNPAGAAPRGKKRGWTMFMEAPLPRETAVSGETTAPHPSPPVDDVPLERHDAPTAEVLEPPRLPSVKTKKTIIAPEFRDQPPETKEVTRPPGATEPHATQAASRSRAVPRPVVETASAEFERPGAEPSVSAEFRPPAAYRAPTPSSRMPLVVTMVLGSAVVLGVAIWLAVTAA